MHVYTCVHVRAIMYVYASVYMYFLWGIYYHHYHIIHVCVISCRLITVYHLLDISLILDQYTGICLQCRGVQMMKDYISTYTVTCTCTVYVHAGVWHLHFPSRLSQSRDFPGDTPVRRCVVIPPSTLFVISETSDCESIIMHCTCCIKRICLCFKE